MKVKGRNKSKKNREPIFPLEDPNKKETMSMIFSRKKGEKKGPKEVRLDPFPLF